MTLRMGLILAGFTALLVTAPISAQEPPRNNSYTALAAAHLQEAQAAVGDDVAAAAAYERALGLSTDGIQSDPTNPQSHFHAGLALVGLGRYLEADSAFTRAEELWPEYLEETVLYRENGWIMAYNEGIGLMGTDDDRALALFMQANTIFDGRPEAFMNTAATLSNREDYEGALQAYEDVRRTLDMPQTRERDEETVARWLTYRTTSMLNTGQLLLATDRADSAAAIYRTILDEEPDNERATSNLAIALAQSGEGDSALTIYEDILADTASSEYDFYNAGVGFYQAESWEKASIAFREVMDRNSMHRDALQNLSQSMVLAAEYEAMLPYSEKLLAMDPHNEFAYRFHARALAETGSTNEAVTLMEDMEALPFFVDNLRIRQMGDTGARVDGVLVNNTLEEGVSIKFLFHFFNRAGTELGTNEVEVNAGPADMALSFELDFRGEEEVSGYSYEVVG